MNKRKRTINEVLRCPQSNGRVALGVVLFLGLFLVNASVGIGGTTRKIEESSEKQSIGGSIFMIGGFIDLYACARSSGDEVPQGVFRLTDDACSEAAVVIFLADKMKDHSTTTWEVADEQRPDGGKEEDPPSKDPKPPVKKKCTDQQIQTCERLSRIGKIETVGKCGCSLKNSPVDSKTGQIKNTELAKVTPPEIKKALVESARTGRLDSLKKRVKGLDKLSKMPMEDIQQRVDDAMARVDGEDFSNFGGGAGAQISADEQEPIDELAEYRAAKEKALFLGPAKRRPKAFLKKIKKRDRSLEAEQRKAHRSFWAKTANDRRSGIIAEPRRALFVTVELRYDALEKKELHPKHYYVKDGRLREIKGIPDDSPKSE